MSKTRIGHRHVSVHTGRFRRANLREFGVLTFIGRDPLGGLQLARYRQTLEGIYGDRLKLRTHALVCRPGAVRLVSGFEGVRGSAYTARGHL